MFGNRATVFLASFGTEQVVAGDWGGAAQVYAKGDSVHLCGCASQAIFREGVAVRAAGSVSRLCE